MKRRDDGNPLLATGLWSGGIGLAAGIAAGYAVEKGDRARVLARSDAAANVILTILGESTAPRALDMKLGTITTKLQNIMMMLNSYTAAPAADGRVSTPPLDGRGSS